MDEIKKQQLRSFDEMEKEIEEYRKLVERRKKEKQFQVRSFWITYYNIKEVYWDIYRFISDIPFTIRKFIWSFYRWSHGWAINDVWCTYGYIAKVSYEMIGHLRKHHMGHPCGISDFDWIRILKKMEKSFRYIYEIGQGDRESYNADTWKNHRKLAKQMRMLTKKEQKEVDFGMKLFQKWMYNLWS